MPKSVYEQIKKQNGERFAKAIRGYDNGIFDVPGIADIVKYAGHEAEPIMEYLESLKKVHIEETGVYQDPLTLLDAAGYDAYYVTNLEEQNRIQKYYAEGEELCTFHDPSRFERYHIINAVRKDVDKFQRKDFIGKEERDKDYGISVLSIQILKSGGFISIKNRYNHTVQNPDNTLGSNPDNIIPGLSNAIRHHFNTDFSAQKIELPHNFTLVNNQIVRYNYEQDNIYFGDNFYAQDGQIHRLKSHEMMLDSHIFDLRTKKLTYPASQNEDAENTVFEDRAFKEVFLKEIEGHKIIIKKDNDGQHLFIRKEGKNDPTQDIEILTVKNGVISSLNLPTTTEIGNNFLCYNRELISFNAPCLINAGKSFLRMNKNLQKINIPMLESARDYFLTSNEQLTSFKAPHLRWAGDDFLHENKMLSEVFLPNLELAGDQFLYCCQKLKRLSLPELRRISGSCFLRRNTDLEVFEAPKLEMLPGNSFEDNKALKTLYLPSLISMESTVLRNSSSLTVFSAPNLRSIGYGSLLGRSLKTLDTPALEEIGGNVLFENTALSHLDLPKVKHIGDDVLFKHMGFYSVDLPEVETIRDNFMAHSTLVVSFRAPKLRSAGKRFLGKNKNLKVFYAPLLKDVPPSSMFTRSQKYDHLWEHRMDKPQMGISSTLKRAEERKLPPAPKYESPPAKEPIIGISERLKQEEQAEVPSPEPTQNASFLKKLKNWFLPQK